MFKRISLLFVFLVMGMYGFAQTDTLVTKKNERIPCKITEIGEDEIKYKRADNPDGPVYSVHKNKLQMMIFANGTREYIKQDEMAVDQKSTPELLTETRSFKIEPFTPFLNHICIGYEQMLKVGTNLEVKVGYIYGGLNTNLRSNYYSYGYNGSGPIYGIGGYVKGGVKFLLGQDFVMRGMRYAHPLKGRYIRFDVDFVTLQYNGVSRWNYTNYGPSQPVTTDVHYNSLGVFVTYGRQFVLGDILTFDYYVGIGAASQATKYSNSAFNTNGYNSYYRDINTNYYAHTMLGNTFATTFGLSVGYIGKGKAPVKKPATATP